MDTPWKRVARGLRFSRYCGTLDYVASGRDDDPLDESDWAYVASYTTNTTKFQFDRGPHRENPCTHWNPGLSFFEIMSDEVWDMIKAYKVLYDEDCPEFLVEESVVDHDLGTRNWEETMKVWLAEHYMPDATCKNAACAEATLEDDVRAAAQNCPPPQRRTRAPT